jgi:RNA polymerase sigma-70 factor (ECF subfamily)
MRPPAERRPVLGTPERSPSDAELARRIRLRDAEALSAWFGRHADAVYGFAFYRVGRNPDLAADVTQETFTRALQQIEKYDPGRGPMIAWLCTLSRNCIRDALRQRGEQSLASLWDAIDASLRRVCADLEKTPLAEEVLEARETRDVVAMTLANLPATYRSVLQAKYVEDKSLKEIADDRASTTDAIKGLLKRARAAFKQTFATLAGTVPHVGELGGTP